MWSVQRDVGHLGLGRSARRSSSGPGWARATWCAGRSARRPIARRVDQENGHVALLIYHDRAYHRLGTASAL